WERAATKIRSRCFEDAASSLSFRGLLTSSGPALVDRFRRIGSDLQVCAVMIGKISFTIQTVLRHELDDLQSAFRAVDVRYLDIRFPWIRRTRSVRKESIHDKRRLRIFLDHR